jgi:hypothetical protein
MNTNLTEKILDIAKQYYESTDNNIVGVGYGLKKTKNKYGNELALVFTVEKKIEPEKIPKEKLLPASIQIDENTLLKTDVVEGSFALALATCADDLPAPSNRQKIRPIKGGLSITNYNVLSLFRGTLGFIAIDNDTNSLVGVTAGHVVIDDQFICSDRNLEGVKTSVLNHIVIQPSEVDNIYASNSIGIVKRYLPLYNDGYNYADAALIAVKKDDLDETFSIRQEGSDYSYWLPFASTEEINSILSSNPPVFFSGRTSGFRGEGDVKLKISEIGTNAYVNFELQGQPAMVDFSNCIKFVAFDSSTTGNPELLCPMNAGDSGAALVAEIDGIRKIIGLIFAANMSSGSIVAGLAARIDKVSELLNISYWNGDMSFFESDLNNIQIIKSDNLNAEFKKTVDEKKFYQVGLFNQ